MVQVAPIGLQYNPRTLWFDPAGVEVKNGDAVVVRTERGVEFGHMVDDVIEVDQAAVKKLLEEKPETYDPKKLGNVGMEAVKEQVKIRMKMCGCDGKAE